LPSNDQLPDPSGTSALPAELDSRNQFLFILFANRAARLLSVGVTGNNLNGGIFSGGAMAGQADFHFRGRLSKLVAGAAGETAQCFQNFWQSHSCRQLYWQGSHYLKIERWIRKIMAAAKQ
jgi:hypothetical protein